MNAVNIEQAITDLALRTKMTVEAAMAAHPKKALMRAAGKAAA
jgi:hypothetical protein